MHKLSIPLVALAIAVFAAGCGSSSSADSKDPSPSSTTTVQTAADAVTGAVDEWSIKVNRSSAPAGKVTFSIVNKGKLPHEFVVLRTAKQADALGKGRRISEDGSVGEIGDIAPGATKKGTFDLKPGHYALVCNIAGHYTAGMSTDFTVK